MKEIGCPICWNKDVKRIDTVYQDSQNKIKPLMFCDLCEEYYWGDTNGIVTNLSILCETFDLSPKLCYLKEGNSWPSKAKRLSKRRQHEFDSLCGFCPNRHLKLKSGSMNGKSGAK